MSLIGGGYGVSSTSPYGRMASRLFVDMDDLGGAVDVERGDFGVVVAEDRRRCAIGESDRILCIAIYRDRVST
jgi:hypothetical protein